MQTFGARAPTTEQSRAWLRPALPVAASVLLVSMVSQFRVPLLPDMGRDLSMSVAQLGLVTTLFAVGRLLLDMPVGRLADRLDPLRLMSAAAAVMAVASLALAVAGSPAWVLASSVLLGAASATGNTTGMTALSGSAPSQRRGSAMALYSGSLLGGQALGPAVSGVVAAAGSWRTAAMAATVLALGVSVAIALWHRRQESGLQRAAAPTAGSDGDAFTSLQLWALYAVGFSVFFTLGAMPQTVVPLIGDDVYGLNAATIGVAIGVGGLARMLGAALSGFVSDHISRRAALLPGLALQAGGVALVAVTSGPVWWVAAIVLMSLGSSGAAVAATMLGDRTSGASLGRRLGRYRFAGDLGLFVGPALAAGAYELAGPGASVAVVASVLVLCTLMATVVLPDTHVAR